MTISDIPVEIIEKVSSLTFIELSWIFSDDGLYNTIYKQLGYVMANYPDENNGFSHEFVDQAKIIFEAVKAGTVDMTDVSKDGNIVITKDGVHIIKLDNAGVALNDGYFEVVLIENPDNIADLIFLHNEFDTFGIALKVIVHSLKHICTLKHCITL